MNDVQERLANCFLTVFPGLTPEQVVEASPMTVAAWDSVTTLTLLTVLEDEFGVTVDYEKAGDLASFRQILSFVESRVS